MPFFGNNGKALVSETNETYKQRMILSNVRQHSCFIIQGSYVGYMFRLINQSSSGL